MLPLRTITLVVLCFGPTSKVSAQSINERHDFWGEERAEFGWGIELRSDGSYLVLANRGYSLDSLYYSSGVSTVTMDAAGVFGDEFRLHVPERANYVGWANPAVPRVEGGYIVGGSTYAEGDTNRTTLFWIEEDGVVSDYRELDLPGRS